MTYLEKLTQAVRDSQSLLCVGLDPNLTRIPASVRAMFDNDAESVAYFCKMVIDYTSEHACAFKPNLAFFESLGETGLAVFKEVVDHIPDNRIIIADAKRGDIHTTAEHYARAFFDVFDVDAITINPLMGMECLDAFSHQPSKAVYALALTSNAGADDFLKKPFDGYDSLAAAIASSLGKYDSKAESHIGMVMGATQAKEMKNILEHHPLASLLIPGIGAQGGSIEELASALEDHPGIPVINSSRSIIFAGQNEENWPELVSTAAASAKTNLEPITKRYA
jgi:orotidine-5'-phosphate decarboxylase